MTLKERTLLKKKGGGDGSVWVELAVCSSILPELPDHRAPHTNVMLTRWAVTTVASQCDRNASYNAQSQIETDCTDLDFVADGKAPLLPA